MRIAEIQLLQQAEELTRFETDANDIKRAFQNLVTGVEDFADIENTTARLMGEMSRRIREIPSCERGKSPCLETIRRSWVTPDSSTELRA